MEALDLLIIGAGPAGIATAVEARRAGIDRLLLLEKAPRHSWSLERLYAPGKRLDRVWLGQEAECLGATCIMDGTRETALSALDSFVKRFLLPIESNTEVERITLPEGGGSPVRTLAGADYHSRTVVVAIGVYGKPNRPSCPIPMEIEGRAPVVDESHHTGVPGLFLAGDLVAGGAGSIIKAFNTGHEVVWKGLCRDWLDCGVPA